MIDDKYTNTDFNLDDKKFMRLALNLAAKAKGRTSPNPLVGAVIVKDGKVISKGYHKKAGLAHAEAEAISLCSNKQILKGAKMYVNLEPCSFYGRTPPCTAAIMGSKIEEVIIAVKDPNPKVSGKGIEELKRAGIKIKTGLCKKEASLLNEVFFKHIKEEMPFVSVKMAASLDGKTAAANGHSKWITGQKSRDMVQRLRYEHDCVLTGINTIIWDDALLYPRNLKTSTSYNLTDKKFYRVVLDSSLKISEHSNLVQTAGNINTVIFISETNKHTGEFRKRIKTLNDKGVEIKTAPQGLDLRFILKTLYDEYGITSVMVESGQTLASSFIKSSLIDKFYLFFAPKFIGGKESYGMFSELGVSDVNKAYNLNIQSIKKTGEDLFVIAYPKEHII